jgi:hypothetical protein
MSTFVRENFVNNIGQILVPGDPIVVVTSSYRVSSKKGIYEGLIKSESYGRPCNLVRYSYVQDTVTKVFTEDGDCQEVQYVGPGKGTCDYSGKTGSYTSYIPTGRRYKEVPVKKKRFGCLQNNNAFKIDTTISQMPSI